MEVNILLVIVGGIIAIGAIVGFAKGAVRIAVSLGATILTLAVVYFATPYVSKAIYSLTPIDEMVEQQCIKTMTKPSREKRIQIRDLRKSRYGESSRRQVYLSRHWKQQELPWKIL